MSIGSWTPETATAELTLEPALLQRLIDFSRDEQLTELNSILSTDEKERLAGLIRIDHSSWQTAVQSLTDQDLHHLIRFFAIAENLPGWEAGEKSPVIPIAKALRKRGHKLDKPLLQWLRSVNDNRFLPYGPL